MKKATGNANTQSEKLREEIERIKDERDCLALLVNHVFDDYLITDKDGVVIGASEHFSELYGFHLEQIIGSRVKDLEQDGHFSPSVTEQVIKTRKPATVVQVAGNGKRFLATGVPIYDTKNRLHRVVSAARDITEQESLTELLRETESLLHYYRQQLVERTMQPSSAESQQVIVKSEEMSKVMDLVRHVSPVDSSVLILGESGTGKEVIAQTLHRWSHRAEGPFVTINCAAIPESLMEAELFGYARGAFTGALKEGKPGLIPLANEGTLFLDEIGEMPLMMQAKLLQVLQEKEVRPIGGARALPVNFRLVAATHRDLQTMIKQGTFREDLFYRLNVVKVELPSLRERPDDIPPLVNHFLQQFGAAYGRWRRMMPETMESFVSYHWPGNIRELRNFVESLVVTATVDVIHPEHLLEPLRSVQPKRELTKIRLSGEVKWDDAHDALVASLIQHASKTCKTTYEMAELLGVSQSTIVRYKNRLKL